MDTSPPTTSLVDASQSTSPHREPAISNSASEVGRQKTSSKERYHPYGHTAQQRAKPHRTWTLAFEKDLFGPSEFLEQHIDKLHSQLLSLGLFPVPMAELKPLMKLNARSCRSMIARLQRDTVRTRERLLELQRANNELEEALYAGQRH